MYTQRVVVYVVVYAGDGVRDLSKGQAFSSYVRTFYHSGVYQGGRYIPLRLLIDCIFIAENSPCWEWYIGGGGLLYPVRHGISNTVQYNICFCFIYLDDTDVNR